GPGQPAVRLPGRAEVRRGRDPAIAPRFSAMSTAATLNHGGSMGVTMQSTRFGEMQIDPESVLEFPTGLIGLGGSRYALLARSEDAAFIWLHSLDDPDLAIPVTNPWRFFSEYEV